MTTYIRYFAATDDSPTGRVALEYLRAMLKLAPVRVLSMSGGFAGAWAGYAPLMSTPMTYPLVNVVCCPPERWWWRQVVGSTTPGQVDAKGPVEGVVELYTSGLRNVMLAACVPPAGGVLSPHVTSAMQYEAMVVPTEQIWAAWATMMGVVVGWPTLVTVPVVDQDAMRAAILS